MHSGQLKSGPWLLQASGLETRPDVRPPGRGLAPQPVNPQHSQTPPFGQNTDEPWAKADWRNGNGGAFHSDVRPAMSSDVPHPAEVMAPNDKRLHALAQGEDPVHDPWNVLGGSGHTFEDLVQNQVGHMQQASPEHNYEGRVWYRAAHEGTKDLSDKTIGDPRKAVAIMSALSPKTDWDENVEKGHHFLTHYTGDPNDPNFILPGMQQPVNKAKAIWHDPNGADREILSGPKTKAFAANILDPTPLREPRPGEHDDAGHYQHPANPHTQEPDWRLHQDQDGTMDTHHVRMSVNAPGASLGHIRYDTPPHFGRTVSVGGQKINPSYDLHARANWEATRRYNAMQADPERHITPKQSQAIAWTKFKNDVDTDPVKKKHMQPAPGVQPKTMGPLTNPIPRYQKERSPDWWDDPRRPKVDLRQTPNWYRRPASRTATADNGSIWGKMLGDYIRRNPQNPPQASNVTPINKITKPRRVRAPRSPQRPTASLWYTAGDEDPLVGETHTYERRPDDHQDDQVTASRWFISRDHDDDDDDSESDSDKPGHSKGNTAAMASGDIGAASGNVSTPSLSQWTGKPSGGGATSPSSSTGGSGPFAGTVHNQYNTGTGGQWAAAHPPGLSVPGGSSGGGGGASLGGGGASGMPSSSSGAGGGVSGGDANVRQQIKDVMGPQFQHYNITDPGVQQHMMDQMYQQGQTESGWRNVPQQVNDINMQQGHPAQGPLQYVPSTQQHALQLAQGAGFQSTGDAFHDQIMGVLPLEMSEGKVNPGSGFTDSSGSGVGYGHGWA